MKKNIFIAILIASAVFAPALPVLAQIDVITDKLKTDTNAQSEAFLEEAGLNKDISLAEVVSVIIYAFLSILGVVFIVLIIYAGFLWMTSAGSEEKIKKAKDIMLAAVIGLIIIFSAYAITVFIFDRVIFGSEGSQAGSAESSPAL